MTSPHPDAVEGVATSGAARLAPRIFALFRPYRGQVALLFFAILLSSGLGVVNPVLTKFVFDRALFPPGGHPDAGLLYVLIAVMVVVAVAIGVIGLSQTYLATVIGQRVMQDVRDRLYAHLQSMSLRFFTSTRTGEIQSRIHNDVAGVQTAVTETASTILSNLVIGVSTLAAMTMLSWQLTLVPLAVIPGFVYLTHRVGRIRRRLASSTQESLADMSAITAETLSVSGILLAKVFNRSGHAIARYQEQNRRLAQLQVRQQMTGRTSFTVAGTFFTLTPALVYLVAEHVISQGSPHISAGTIVAFTALQTRLFFPVMQMLQVWAEAHSSLALFERVFQYLDLPREIVDTHAARPLTKDQVRGRVSFRDVHFRYDHMRRTGDSDELAELEGVTLGLHSPSSGLSSEHGAQDAWTVEGLDFDIEPGQLAALVGPSGAGKTTTAYLIPRLYDASAGMVAIDGIDVREIALSSLAELIGMVTQETYLFHTSVRENLLYAKPHATREQIEHAAQTALIHERITNLADGYETLVGERGYRMSGGEKQRLAIARVLLKDPRILILDEATSALDTNSERFVQRALQPLIRDRTTIAIAHRLSTILAADVIFVLERGRIVERGTFEQLISRRGLFAALYEQQFGAGAVEARCSDGVILRGGESITLDPGDQSSPPSRYGPQAKNRSSMGISGG